MQVTKAIILAAGRGTRMRADDTGTRLTRQQSAAANDGVKALIPIDRPFLDYVLTRVADAGCDQVCLVIGPDHHALREYYTHIEMKRLTIHFAIQDRPLGTAHALLSAADFINDQPFLVLNSDNYYPAETLRAICQTQGHALVGYLRDALVAKSNIPSERIARFAIVQRDTEGLLKRIVEKPTAEFVQRLPPPILISMNSWRFDPDILNACRAIGKSARGEYEIPDAVTHAMKSVGAKFQVVPADQPVLDLSSRRDIESVTQHLRGVNVQL